MWVRVRVWVLWQYYERQAVMMGAGEETKVRGASSESEKEEV